MLTVFVDNTTVAYINRQGGTRPRTLSDLAALLWIRCHQLTIHLTASYLAGRDNVVADALSRGRFDNGAWTLNQHWVDLLFQRYGRPYIDLFATSEGRRLPTFCARRFHPQAWRTDAFSFEWDDLRTYAFPPWCLLQRVLTKVLGSRNLRMLLVAPCWPNQPGFPMLLHLLGDRPTSLPGNQKLLTPSRGRVWFREEDLQHLHLAAWQLAGDVSVRREFQRGLPSLYAAQDDLPRLGLTIPGSPDSTRGQRTAAVIPWMPRWHRSQTSSRPCSTRAASAAPSATTAPPSRQSTTGFRRGLPWGPTQSSVSSSGACFTDVPRPGAWLRRGPSTMSSGPWRTSRTSPYRTQPWST